MEGDRCGLKWAWDIETGATCRRAGRGLSRCFLDRGQCFLPRLCSSVQELSCKGLKGTHPRNRPCAPSSSFREKQGECAGNLTASGLVLGYIPKRMVAVCWVLNSHQSHRNVSSAIVAHTQGQFSSYTRFLAVILLGLLLLEGLLDLDQLRWAHTRASGLHKGMYIQHCSALTWIRSWTASILSPGLAPSSSALSIPILMFCSIEKDFHSSS